MKLYLTSGKKRAYNIPKQQAGCRKGERKLWKV